MKTFHTKSQSTSVDDDQFLKSKQIQVQRSDFLANHYASKSLNLRESYNPKDIHGKRLSSFWKQGDTMFSVIMKRMKRNVLKVFNPDTYSKDELIKFKQQMIKDKLNLIAIFLVIMTPTIIAHPIIKPRIKAIRRQMIFQYYMQAGMLSRQLKAPLEKIPKEEIEKIINRASQKISF